MKNHDALPWPKSFAPTVSGLQHAKHDLCSILACRRSGVLSFYSQVPTCHDPVDQFECGFHVEFWRNVFRDGKTG